MTQVKEATWKKNGLAARVAWLIGVVAVVWFGIEIAPGLYSLVRDDTDANNELAALVKEVNSTTTRADVKNAVDKAQHLKPKDLPESRLRVSTPFRMFAQHWIAELDFRPNGSVLGVRSGTLDSFNLNIAGMPPDRCFGSPSECAQIGMAATPPGSHK